MALHQTQVGLKRALADAERAYLSDQSEDALARILELREMIEERRRAKAIQP